MEIETVRRENLNALIAELSGEANSVRPLAKRMMELEETPPRERPKRLKSLSNQIDQWRKGGPSGRVISNESARKIETAGGKPKAWLDIRHGDDAAQDAGNPEGTLPLDLTIHRLEHDVDQLRTTIWNFMDVLISRIPVSGMAAELVARLETDAEAKGDPRYGDKGFHVRVLNTLRTIAQTQEAASSSALPFEDRGPSRRKRAL